MIIYFDPPEKSPARYLFRLQGHTIRYAITFPERNSVVFQSEPSEAGPRYRLSHRVTGLKFEGELKSPRRAHRITNPT